MKRNSKTHLYEDTTVERHQIGHGRVFVKREDRCCWLPGPPFAKMRGVVRGLMSLKAQGVEVVGYSDTAISMANWGLAWASQFIGLKALAYYPQYKNGPPPLMAYHQEMARGLGASIEPIENPTLGAINHIQCKKLLHSKYGGKAYMVPFGMPFPETTVETEKEARRTLEEHKSIQTLVINIGSGTICAGVLRAVHSTNPRIHVYGISCRHYDTPRALQARRDLIFKKARIPDGGLVGLKWFQLVNTDYEYPEQAPIGIPFPCNPFYDAKAWEWLFEHYDELEKPILFWNIGGGGTVP